VTPTAAQADAAGEALLAALESVYRNHSVRHDIFGRRAALPSEIARALARNGDEPSGCTSSSARTTAATDAIGQTMDEG